MEVILPKQTSPIKDKLFKWLKLAYKICIAANGAAAFTNPISAAITGGVAIASAISATVKDKQAKPAMKLVNIIACNYDKAKNDQASNT